jgi:hypothetical protein
MPHEKGGKQHARPVVRRSDRWVVARVVRRSYDEGRPGRRIGRRGDTTRAPTQGPRPKGGAARCRPVFPFRDWHEGGKSRASGQTYTLPYFPTPVSPFHAEPLQSDMIRRCRSPKYANAQWYRERGIDVCEEWGDPEVFFQWALSSGYRDDLTIDRIDNNKGYSPENCRWATQTEQARNRSSNLLVSAFGETRKVFEWIEDPRCKVRKAETIQSRIRCGWSGQEAISTPVGQSRRTVLAWGENKSVPEWFQDPRCKAKSTKTIRARLLEGWSPEDAIGLPTQVRGRKHTSLK